ncbi:MAG: HAD family hydrolase [Vicinamibacterales bacterium]
MKLVLFDIDGTLINTAGAGVRAMSRVFVDLYGTERALDGLAFAGRTDRVIVEEALARVAPGESIGDPWWESFRAQYCGLLERELRESPSSGSKVLPGIRPLLDALRNRPDVVLALLTGNFAQSAQVKLAHFALWDYFCCGAFGDDHVDRNHLFDVALSAAIPHKPAAAEWDEVVVIGDTPLDVACALSGNATALAVATGIYTSEALRASGAHHVFDDLSDTDHVLRSALRLS